ncbi:MAG TPA: ABC transporter ATP-binding protein [Patescibacteria group bacterium]|jgi:ABC-type lipoprotein export system ATPase subunit|nr:ABC transporter ATP-binding protein [Patescibacteria group bacterium]
MMSPAAAATVLEMRGLWRTYARGPETVEALRGVDLVVHPGRIVAIVGASGSGKTTLLNIAGGVDRPSAGEVHLLGRRIDGLPESELTKLRRHQVGMVFQEFHLMQDLTALENVRLPLIFSGSREQDRALELMDRVEITARRSFYPRELSGGEQQRVAIARALIHKPSLLLGDEPTGNLDSAQAGRILDLFRLLTADGTLAILLATHDELVARRADVVYRLSDGMLTDRRENS